MTLRHGDRHGASVRSRRFPLRKVEGAADPPKVLAIGPDPAGNLLEIIWLELADDVQLVIHAMPLRPTFYDLLPQPREDTP